MGMQNNSVIMAAGMSIPMPAIVNPLNTEEWKREREESQKKEPKFSSVKWAKTSCKEGEEIELSAGVKDITDGNMVTLQVFREGQSPEDSAAIAKFPLSVKGGSVFAKWSYRTNGNDIPAERNPRFIFSAHSAWCPWKKSENSLEVELRRPKIEKTEWQDTEGKAASKGIVGTPLKLYCEVTEFEEGQGVTFTVYNARTGEVVYEAGADVKDGKAEAQWTYHWDGEPLEEKPKYYFEVTANRCKPVKSEEAEMGAKIKISLIDDFNKSIKKGYKAILYLSDGSTEEISFDSEGKYERTDLIPGKYTVKLKAEK